MIVVGVLSLVAILAAAIAALSAIGAITAMTRAPTEPAGTRIEVAPGRHLHVRCEGPPEAPFVLYDAGAFGIHADGWWIQQHLKSDYRVCLYDRAGLGWSDPPPPGQAPTPDWHVEDMRRLRDALGQTGPFILVGHSMAGLRLHAWANLYPEEIAGLVFIDAVRPQTLDRARAQRFFPWALRAMDVGIGLARIGALSGLATLLPDPLELPPDAAGDKRRAMGRPAHHRAARAEIAAVLAQGLETPWLQGAAASERPVSVFTNSPGGGGNAPVAAAAAEQVGFGRVTVIREATHVSLLDRSNAGRIAADIRDMSRRGGDRDG